MGDGAYRGVNQIFAEKIVLNLCQSTKYRHDLRAAFLTIYVGVENSARVGRRMNSHAALGGGEPARHHCPFAPDGFSRINTLCHHQ